MDTLRGVDATGVMYGDNRQNVFVHKGAIPGYEFIDTPEWNKTKTSLFQNGKWLVGHNRAATRGSKTDVNAHPFNVEDKIVLVQNGTYSGDHKHLKDTEVDTEACAHVIAENDDISTALKKIDAAYVFVWYNTHTDCLHIIRNDERPLFVARTKTGGLCFASDGHMLSAAAQRNKVDLRETPYLLNDGHLCTFKMVNGTHEDSYKDIDITYSGARPFVSKGYGKDWWQGYKGSNDVTPINKPSSVVSQLAGMLSCKAINPEVFNTVEIQARRDVLARQKKVEGEVKYKAEGLDYCKASSSTNDNLYYVYGSVVCPEADPMSGQIVCWTITIKDETELLAYTIDNLFEVTLDYIVQRGNQKQDSWNILYNCSAATIVSSFTPLLKLENVH